MRFLILTFAVLLSLSACFAQGTPVLPDSGKAVIPDTTILQSPAPDSIPPLSASAAFDVAPQPLIDHRPLPLLPKSAREAGTTGKAVVDIFVDRTGAVRKWQIEKVKPVGLGLEAEVERVMPSWQFTPAMKDGKPVATWIAIPLDFASEAVHKPVALAQPTPPPTPATPKSAMQLPSAPVGKSDSTHTAPPAQKPDSTHTVPVAQKSDSTHTTPVTPKPQSPPPSSSETKPDSIPSLGTFIPFETPPQPLPDSSPQPAYPERAKSSGAEGKVTMQLYVDAQGVVKKWELVEAKPESLGFEEEVAKVIPQWKFTPATQGGKPVGVWVAIPFNFKYKK